VHTVCLESYFTILVFIGTFCVIYEFVTAKLWFSLLDIISEHFIINTDYKSSLHVQEYTMIADNGVFYDVLHLKWPRNIHSSIT